MHQNLVLEKKSEFQALFGHNAFRNPWMHLEILEAMESFFGSTAIVIEHKNSKHTVAIGIFFVEEKDGLKVLYSGGRFGTIGFEEQSNHGCDSSCISNLIKLLMSFGFDSVSIRWDLSIPLVDWNETSEISQCDSVFLTKKNYYITSMAKTIKDSELIFTNAKVRNNLTRNLIKSYELGFDIKVTRDLDDLKSWFSQCHQARMEELDAVGWDYAFFEGILSTREGLLFLVLSNNRVVGGCVCIRSSTDLELIMMSTPHEFLVKSVNYFLTNEIYKWAELQGLAYVNWQASNPPGGGVAKFKQAWNADIKEISIFSSKCSDLSDQKIREVFPDRFIFPYS